MKYFKSLLIIFCSIAMIGCEDYFGENANLDPDNPATATVNVILPQVQARMAYTWGGDFTRYLGINTQHVDGAGRQFAVIGNYGIQPADVNTAWRNVYSGILNSNLRMKEIATENSYPHYQAISMFLEAYTYMMATDAWGDIPYSDALKFNERGVYSPMYDTQNTIYDGILSTLNSTLSLFNGDGGDVVPGGDDLFYAGDISKWIKATNVLIARANLHLSKVNGNSAYSAAIAAINAGGFESAEDNFAFAFGPNPSENAPWYQYIEQRDDCETGATYVSMLNGLNDPRVATYGFEHAVPGHPVFTPDQTVALVSYTEQQFILAEALLATGDASAAYDAYIAGIESSFGEAGVDGAADYIAQAAVGVGADNLTMDQVMTQKYLALYTSPEVFNDWRRTGIPSLSPNSGTQIPRRLPYPQTELDANPDNVPSPANVTIFSKVWWDQ